MLRGTQPDMLHTVEREVAEIEHGSNQSLSELHKLIHLMRTTSTHTGGSNGAHSVSSLDSLIPSPSPRGYHASAFPYTGPELLAEELEDHIPEPETQEMEDSGDYDEDEDSDSLFYRPVASTLGAREHKAMDSSNRAHGPIPTPTLSRKSNSELEIHNDPGSTGEDGEHAPHHSPSYGTTGYTGCVPPVASHCCPTDATKPPFSSSGAMHHGGMTMVPQ